MVYTIMIRVSERMIGLRRRWCE